MERRNIEIEMHGVGVVRGFICGWQKKTKSGPELVRGFDLQYMALFFDANLFLGFLSLKLID